MCMRRQNKDDDTTSLDYRHSSLTDVPSDVFTHERTLEELRLDSNHIRDLPRVRGHAKSLHSRCVLTSLFSVLKKFFFMKGSC